MRFCGCAILSVFFACYPISATANINVDEIVIDLNAKIKTLAKKNKDLREQLEQLQEKQKVSSQKIEELFHLINHQKSDETAKKALLRVKEQDEKAKRLYTDATSLLASGQHDKAIELFTDYLLQYAQNNYAPSAQYWLARSYYAKEDYQNAKITFIEFQLKNPLHYKFANSLFELANIYLELGDKAKAKELLDSMLKRFPQHYLVTRAQQLLDSIVNELQSNTIVQTEEIIIQ